MKRRFLLRCLAAWVAVLSLGCDREPPPVRVAAAASLADVLVEIAEGQEPAVQFNLAGSSELSRQILAGAPMDLFLSADRAQIDRLSPRIDVTRAEPLLANRLVLITPRGSVLEGAPSALIASARVIVIADPEGVPAGVYARRWLEERDLWQRAANRVVPALDVRAALAAVASGAADLGIVYATDAMTSDRVEVRFAVPAEETPWIRYWLLPLDGRPETEGFRQLLRGPRAAQIFVRHGFVPLEPAGEAS